MSDEEEIAKLLYAFHYNCVGDKKVNGIVKTFYKSGDYEVGFYSFQLLYNHNADIDIRMKFLENSDFKANVKRLYLLKSLNNQDPNIDMFA